MVRSLAALLGISTRGSVLRSVVWVSAKCIVRVWARGVTGLVGVGKRYSDEEGNFG